MKRVAVDPKELDQLFKNVKKPRRPACRHGHKVSVENMSIGCSRRGQYVCGACWKVNHDKYLARCMAACRTAVNGQIEVVMPTQESELPR